MHTITGFPDCRGTKVSPSGRLPSDLNKPTGSLVAGMPADTKALVTHNIIERLMSGYATVKSTHIHLGQHTCGTHRLLPRRKPTATRMALSSNLELLL